MVASIVSSKSSDGQAGAIYQAIVRVDVADAHDGGLDFEHQAVVGHAGELEGLEHLRQETVLVARLRAVCALVDPLQSRLLLMASSLRARTTSLREARIARSKKAWVKWPKTGERSSRSSLQMPGGPR